MLAEVLSSCWIDDADVSLCGQQCDCCSGVCSTNSKVTQLTRSAQGDLASAIDLVDSVTVVIKAIQILR
jgi:hypothetical protein